MDPFAVVVLAGLAIVFGWLWLVGCANQRGRAQASLGLRSARQIVEEREALEAEDLAQLLEAHNVRRRGRGEADVSELDVEREIAARVRSRASER